MIKWLIIYALYEKIKRDHGITADDITLQNITQALRELNPEQMARDLFHAGQSIMSDPAVEDFMNTLAEFIMRFLKALFSYYNSGGM